MSGGYSYIIELVDQISGPAKTARQQIDQLTSALKRDADELKRLEANQRALNALGMGGSDVAKKLTSEINAKKNAMTGAASKIRSLVKGEDALVAKSKEASSATMSMGDSLAGLGSYATMAVGAVLAVVAAIGALVFAGAKIAIDAAQFKARTTAALASVSGIGENARGVFLEIRKISDELGISEAKAQTLGLSLLDAGIKDISQLSAVIKSIALLERARGSEAAKKLEELVKKSAAAGTFKLEGESLVGTGLSKLDVLAELAKKLKKSTAEVDALLKAGQISAADGISAINDALTSKLGGAKGLVSVQEAAEKIYEMFTRLFEDVDTSPLTNALKEVAGWLDTSKPAGEALKWLVTTLFDGMFAAAQQVLPYVKFAFLELVIAALKIYIAFKPIKAQLVELHAEFLKLVGGGDTLFTIIKIGVGAAVIGFQILFGIISVILVVVGEVIAVISMLGSAFSATFQLIAATFDATWSILKQLFSVEGATQIANDLITGLVNGITGGAAQVVAAITGVGQSAINGVKGVLGIASPSSVAKDLAGNFTSSFATEAEEGSGATQSAMASAVSPPQAGSASAGGGGVQVTIAEGAFQISVGGGLDAAKAEEILETKLQEFFDSIAMQLGGATT